MALIHGYKKYSNLGRYLLPNFSPIGRHSAGHTHLQEKSMDRSTAAQAIVAPLATATQAPTNRRFALNALGSLGVATLFGCGGGDTETTDTTDTTGTGTGTGTGTTTTCSVVPEETAGPYPADGSTASNNTYNVLALSGIVRSDIRSSIGSSPQGRGGPLTLTLTPTQTNATCAAPSGYAIYLWHCT